MGADSGSSRSPCHAGARSNDELSELARLVSAGHRRERFEAFGTAGNAPKIKVIPMSEMAKRYAAGSLDPRVTTQIAA